MSDMGDDFKEMREVRQFKRRYWGVDCPVCRERFPRGTPSILIPCQRCNVDGYVDRRPGIPTATVFAKMKEEESK